MQTNLVVSLLILVPPTSWHTAEKVGGSHPTTNFYLWMEREEWNLLAESGWYRASLRLWFISCLTGNTNRNRGIVQISVWKLPKAVVVAVV